MLRARVGDEVIAEAPTVALNDVPQGGIFRRMVDGVILMFN
jgi:D-alanyl-D-alanine carboxypeptidase